MFIFSFQHKSLIVVLFVFQNGDRYSYFHRTDTEVDAGPLIRLHHSHRGPHCSSSSQYTGLRNHHRHAQGEAQIRHTRLHRFTAHPAIGRRWENSFQMQLSYFILISLLLYQRSIRSSVISLHHITDGMSAYRIYSKKKFFSKFFLVVNFSIRVPIVFCRAQLFCEKKTIENFTSWKWLDRAPRQSQPPALGVGWFFCSSEIPPAFPAPVCDVHCPPPNSAPVVRHCPVPSPEDHPDVSALRTRRIFQKTQALLRWYQNCRCVRRAYRTADDS